MVSPLPSAKKSLGQNFLIDKNIINKIVDVINPEENIPIIEIGPGPASLTRPLLKRGGKVIAIEKDNRMADILNPLKEEFPHQLEVIYTDTMKVDLTKLTSSPVKLVGNLPYNIGTQIVFNALKTPEHFTSLTFMLQKEVVSRIIATAHTSDWGRLGIWCDLLCERKKCFDVPPTAFLPRPKVTSSIAQLKPFKTPRFVVNRKNLEKILHATFTKRRKMLRKSLKGIITEEQLTNININPASRPEELTTEEFCKLANI